VLGGEDGGVNSVTVFQGGKAHVPPHLSKEQDIPLKAGDRVRVGTPGGGGYGNPFARDTKAVLEDFRMGYYTAEQTAVLFGVAISDGAVDEDATAELRERPSTHRKEEA
jgi:N-methylhydantoinase B